VEDAVRRLGELPVQQIAEFAQLDGERALRVGGPEVIYGERKRPEQIGALVAGLVSLGQAVLVTRMAPEAEAAALAAAPTGRYDPISRTFSAPPPAGPPPREGLVAVVCAGTTDIPVAEEACATAHLVGAQVERLYDVGVSGLHRLLRHAPALREADAVVVCAGMEGALPSVVGGLAGAMVGAALLHLGAPRAALDDGLRRLGFAGVSVEVREVEVAGIRALHADIRTPEEGHAHRRWREIRDLLSRSRLPPRAAELAESCFALLAKAEGRIHGIAPDEVEFHETGSIDSLVAIVGAALLVDALAPGRIVALPPPSGGGTAPTAHGVIPIPAPATLEVLRGRSLRPSGPGERTTPTGAAIIAAWTEESPAVPELTVDRIGYGAGAKRWEDAPNLLRAMLGRTAAQAGEAAWRLETNLGGLLTPP